MHAGTVNRFTPAGHAKQEHDVTARQTHTGDEAKRGRNRKLISSLIPCVSSLLPLYSSPFSHLIKSQIIKGFPP